MLKLLTNTILVLVLACAVSAQQADVASLRESSASAQSGFGVNPAGNPFSLIDLSRISWSHSYSVSFFSGGNSSGSVGLLNTSMDYEISSKLHLSVNLGVMHQPGALWNGDQSGTNFLPGFRLDYRPSKNFHISISAQEYGGYISPYNRWYR